MPSLKVYRSNKIEVLAHTLVQLMRATGGLPEDPMKSIDIVVGSRGQERWLRHRIATELGICAQVEFPFQQSFLRSLLDTILDEEPQTGQTWSQASLTFAILTHLSSIEPQDGPLGNLQAKHGEPVSSRQLSHAQQIASVLDRYGLYRPALMRAWCGWPEADPPRLPEHLQWQAALWQGIGQILPLDSHPVIRTARAIERLQASRVTLAGPIRVFGFAALPPAWLDFLGQVAHQVDVELYALCPSTTGWGQEQTEHAVQLRTLDRELELPQKLQTEVIHPLHLSLGRAARDTQIVIESISSVQHELLIDETQLGPGCALHHLQADILHGRTPGEQRHALITTDRSVQFHACHGAARQVEVVRDVILGLLDDHPDLEPRDIIIMTPDIGTYAPLLEGAFGRGEWQRASGEQPWGPSGSPRVQLEVADLSVRRTNPVADALLQILSASADRLTASRALDLLGLEPVASRFGLDPGDTGKLRAMVVESGIRWGIDAEDRQQAGQSPDIQNTFAFGLDRLALGVVMADEGLAIHLAEDGGGLTPWDAAEQAETLTLLGRFFDFSEALSASIRALQTPRTLLEWVTTITEPETGVLDRLTRTEGVSEWLSLRVRTELSELAAEARTAQSTQAYRLDTLQALLTGRFEVPSGMSRQQTGAITCCALRPMRSVPYRVVCMIGMDEGQFPKQATLPGFDWTGLSPRAGDKIPRDEDRLMLLEAILSARSHLVISYTGRSVRTNEACQPCVPIAELQEVIDKSFSVDTARPAESLMTAHALHNFSPENFASTQGRPPRSFDCRLMAAAQAGLRPRTDPTFLPLNGPIPHARREPDTVIDLETLADFFSNPARALLKQRFGLRLREYSVEVEDQVPVELSGPDRRRIQRDLMARTLVQMAQLGEDLTEQTQMSDWLAPVVDHMRAAGGLPPGPAGRHVLAPQLSVLEHLCETCEDLLTTQPSSPSVRIPLTIQGRKIEVVGQTHQIRDGAMTIFVPRADTSGTHMWWLIQPWIELIAGIASDPDAPKKLGVVHAYDKDGDPKLQFRVFGPDWPADTAQVQAQALLAWMVECHQAGMDRPLAIYPQTSFQFASAIHKWNRTEDQDMPIGPESFEPGQDPPPKDALKDAMQRAKKAWGGPDSRSGDSHEVHIGHLYGNARPYLSAEHPYPPMPDRHFAHHALRLWLPIIASRELISGGKKAMSNFVAALAPEGSS